MYRQRCHPAATAFLLLASLAACSEMGTPSLLSVSPGILQLSGVPAVPQESPTGNAGVAWTVPPGEDTRVPDQVLAAPDTVAAGEAFLVRVRTIGENGCWRAQRQELSVSGRIAELRPFDAHSGARVCTDVLLYLEHASTLTLHERGDWVLRVSGRRVAAGGSGKDVGVSAEKRIVVR